MITEECICDYCKQLCTPCYFVVYKIENGHTSARKDICKNCYEAAMKEMNRKKMCDADNAFRKKRWGKAGGVRNDE